MIKLNRLILAALFARSNMGHEVKMQDMEDMILHPPSSLDDAIFSACGQFMESEDDEDVWLEEGRSWFQRFCQLTDAEIKKQWPCHIVIYLVAASEDV